MRATIMFAAAVCLAVLLGFPVASPALQAEEGGPEVAPAVETEVHVNCGKVFSLHGNDVERLQALAGGVGSDVAIFEPVIPRLRDELRIKHVRLINGLNPGRRTDSVVDGEPDYDFWHAKQVCDIINKIGATPYVVIGPTPPFCTSPDDPLPQGQKAEDFVDWCVAAFEQLNIENDYNVTHWMVANEPDSCNDVYYKAGLPPEEHYQKHLSIYRLVARAVEKYERAHPDAPRLKLGGLGLCGGSLGAPDEFWAMKFDWFTRFARDCAEQNIRCDFMTYNFYSSDDSWGLPPDPECLQMVRHTIDRYLPGREFVVSEWGGWIWPGNMGMANANEVQAAHCAMMLYQMMAAGVDSALFLCVADYHPDTLKRQGQWPADKAVTTDWVWSSLFTYGGTYVKTPFNAFKMVQMLAKQRVAASGSPLDQRHTGVLASREDERITILLWNHDWKPDRDHARGGRSLATDRQVEVNLYRLPFEKEFLCRRYVVDSQTSNSFYLAQNGLALDGREELQMVSEWRVAVGSGKVLLPEFSLPAESVVLLELVPAEGSGTDL